MANDIQERPQASGKLSTWVENPAAQARIEAALGGVMPVETFVAHMLTAFQTDTVRNCTPQSQFTAIHECAAMGLLPTLNQVKLIPYGDQIKAMPQWQGFKALMERHPDVFEVTAVLVHVGDHFAFSDGFVSHVYDPFDPNRKIESSKDIRGGYLKILYLDGRPPRFHMVAVAHIEKCRKCAQTQKVWGAWYEQMALKTLYRDAFARRAVPMDPFAQSKLQAALDIEDVNMGNRPDFATETKTARLIAVQDHAHAAQEAIQEPPFNPPTQTEAIEAQSIIEAQDAAASTTGTQDEADCLSSWRDILRSAESISDCNNLEADLTSAPEKLRASILELILARKAEIRNGRGARAE